MEDFLFCKAVPGRTNREELFQLLDNFLSSWRYNGLDVLVYVLMVLLR